MSFQTSSSRHKHEYLKLEYANSRILHHEMPVDPDVPENDGLMFGAEAMMLPVSPQSYSSPEPYRPFSSDREFLIQELITPVPNMADPFSYLDVDEVSEERQDHLYFGRAFQLPQIQEQQPQRQQQQPSYTITTPQTPTSLPPSPNSRYPHILPYFDMDTIGGDSILPAEDSAHSFEELARHWSRRTETNTLNAHKTEDVDIEMTAWQPRANHPGHSLPSPLVTSFDVAPVSFTRKRKIEDSHEDAMDCKHHRQYVSPPDSPEMEMDRLKLSSPAANNGRVPGQHNVGGGNHDRRRPSSRGTTTHRGPSSTTRKNLVCPVCTKKFTRFYNMTSHIDRVHNQIRKFHCEYEAPDGTKCRVKFSAKGDLQRHARIHSEEKPYGCKHDGCDQVFSRTEQRDRHHTKCARTCTDPECRHNA